MFWQILLPMKITAILCAAVVGALTFMAPFMSWNRTRTFAWSLWLTVILFIPSCMVIEEQVDKTRFGGFAFAQSSSIRQERIRDWIPPAAKDITVHCDFRGFAARYRIDRNQMLAWFNEFRSRHAIPGDRDPLDEHELKTIHLDEEYIRVMLPDYGWLIPEQVIEMNCQVDESGAGFRIWYSEQMQTAFVQASYW